jgi:catechol 2,3-dioxygenase-like lactoylglutathione lyase family enzyme
VSGLRYCLHGLLLFTAGVMVGTIVMQPSAAQENVNTSLRLNHVGIAVTDFHRSVDFYTKVMGFRKAFGGDVSADGRQGTIYLQISKETFLEIAPASANLPPGITHIGLQTDSDDATVARLRQLGATVTDARVVPVLSKSKLANATDPNGIRLELVEAIPGSLIREAEESWK